MTRKEQNVKKKTHVISSCSLVAQQQRICLPVQEMRIQSLGQEDALEREWQPTPVFLPGESYGQGSLACYSVWG